MTIFKKTAEYCHTVKDAKTLHAYKPGLEEVSSKILRKVIKDVNLQLCPPRVPEPQNLKKGKLERGKERRTKGERNELSNLQGWDSRSINPMLRSSAPEIFFLTLTYRRIQRSACKCGNSGPMYVPEISLFCPQFDNVCPQNLVFSYALKSGLFYTASMDYYFLRSLSSKVGFFPVPKPWTGLSSKLPCL